VEKQKWNIRRMRCEKSFLSLPRKISFFSLFWQFSELFMHTHKKSEKSGSDKKFSYVAQRLDLLWEIERNIQQKYIKHRRGKEKIHRIVRKSTLRRQESFSFLCCSVFSVYSMLLSLCPSSAFLLDNSHGVNENVFEQ
jgi:hypothetical protein